MSGRITSILFAAVLLVSTAAFAGDDNQQGDNQQGHHDGQQGHRDGGPAVPEPTAALLFAGGLAVAGMRMRRRSD